MKYIKLFESFSEDIIETISDIFVELEDKGFEVKVENISEPYSYNKICIKIFKKKSNNLYDKYHIDEFILEQLIRLREYLNGSVNFIHHIYATTTNHHMINISRFDDKEIYYKNNSSGPISKLQTDIIFLEIEIAKYQNMSGIYQQ